MQKQIEPPKLVPSVEQKEPDSTQTFSNMIPMGDTEETVRRTACLKNSSTGRYSCTEVVISRPWTLVDYGYEWSKVIGEPWSRLSYPSHVLTFISDGWCPTFVVTSVWWGLFRKCKGIEIRWQHHFIWQRGGAIPSFPKHIEIRWQHHFIWQRGGSILSFPTWDPPRTGWGTSGRAAWQTVWAIHWITG